MKTYTQQMDPQEIQLSPEDEFYSEKLIEVAKKFRLFDEAMDDFIIAKGYSGDVSNVDLKVEFIMDKFKNHHIEIAKRTVKNWFIHHVRAKDRRIAFQICFAFELNLLETQSFFRRIYLQRGIDCHDMAEAIYYYCISHRLSYQIAQQLIDKIKPSEKKGRIDFDGEILFTSSIIQELDRFSTTDELMTFLDIHRDHFEYNNATAYKYIRQLWQQIAGEKGLANKESKLLLHPNRKNEKDRSVWDIYLQIFGYMDYDLFDDNTKLFELKNDRTLKPIFTNNALIHPIATASFPDRQGLEAMIRGEHKSSEVVRKTLILLSFYKYWAENGINHHSLYEQVSNEDSKRCLFWMNKLLLDSGYPAMYEGNPFDWIFIYASFDTYPLDAFRFFMREVYLHSYENENSDAVK